MQTASGSAPATAIWMGRIERFSDAFGLVFVLVLVDYVLVSLLSLDGWSAVLITFATSATSMVALVSSEVRLPMVHAAFVLSAVSLVLAAIGALSGIREWFSAVTLFQVTLLTVAMLTLLRRVITTEKIGSKAILGALSIYTVLGLLFTFVYSAIDRLQSSPFFEGVAHPAGSDFLFFSYTTLTTTGFGDLVPAGQPGRMIAGLEMMIGQVFLVTLVAGLVSLWRPGEALRRRRERRAGGGEAAGSAESG
jgi:Ion channel